MLDVTLQQIEKQFGKGAVMSCGTARRGPASSSPRGRWLWTSRRCGVSARARGGDLRPRESGKTTVSLHIIASAGYGIAAFVDAEHALDPTYARELGVNIDELLVSQPDSRAGVETADMLGGPPPDLVVIDSVAALVPRAEIEGEMGDTHGSAGPAMSRPCASSGSLSKFDTTAISSTSSARRSA
jgi:recombination protein RecA